MKDKTTKELEKYFKNKKIYIWKETFAILKSKRTYPDAFANIIDKNDITVIIDQSKYNEEDIIEIQKDWKILTFDMVLPFNLIGFFAKVSDYLANKKITIFTVSAYSTDHILVKKKDLSIAIKELEKLGFSVEVR